VITEIAWDGSIRRRALDTASLTDPGRCENLIAQVLAIPPPYRATSGRPVYVLHASDRAVVMGEDNLVGSLQQLVTTVLAAGDPCLCSVRAGGDSVRARGQHRRPDAIAGHWIGSARRECLDRMLIAGERHLRLVLREYADHHNTHRPHRALNQNPPPGEPIHPQKVRVSMCRRATGSVA
jgi:transposase InsO family protein